MESSSSNGKIEILSRGTLGHPAFVRIGEQEYVAYERDPNTILALEDIVRDLLLKDLPLGLAITPCKKVDFFEEWVDSDLEIPITPSRFEGIAPFRIYKMSNGRAGVVFSWHCTKSFWNNESGYRWKIQRAKEVALARRKSLGSISFYRWIDQGDLAGVEFLATLKAASLESVMQAAYKISESLHETIENAFSLKSKDISGEAAYVQNSFIPLLKKLGFQNVVFNHGPREFGRDVLFSRQTEFSIPEYWAAQVKLGNVSGRSNSYIDLIVNQAQEAFKIPWNDIQTKSKVWISKFIVAITGKFSENAVEKICEKIESHSQRNNIIFLDGEKIEELIQSSGLKITSKK